MEIYIDLGLCAIRVEAAQPELLDAIKDLFKYRTTAQPPANRQILDCRVHDDPQKFNSYAEVTSFDSCTVKVGHVVTAQYYLGDGVTRVKIDHTAIIEFTDADPLTAHVFLEPLANSGKTERPLPEAFFYPMVVEWLRNIDAYLVHCGAVTLTGRGVLLIGPPGSGKSTHVLRMVKRGANFLADDLMLIHRQGEDILLRPFREVANLGEGSVERFPEMAFIKRAPRRGDGKFQVDIADFFDTRAEKMAKPGIVLHLHPDQDSWIQELPTQDSLAQLYNMAFFLSRKTESADNFFILTELMLDSYHLEVSQGYLAENLDGLMAEMATILAEKTD